MPSITRRSASSMFSQSEVAARTSTRARSRSAAHRLQHRRTGLAIDLDVEIRLEYDGVARRDLGARESGAAAVGVPHHALDRVHDEVDAEPVAVELHRDRVDEERHVVVDDLDDRVRSVPALGRPRRRVHADEGMPRRALRAELPVRSRRGREVLGRPLLQIGGRERARSSGARTARTRRPRHRGRRNAGPRGRRRRRAERRAARHPELLHDEQRDDEFRGSRRRQSARSGPYPSTRQAKCLVSGGGPGTAADARPRARRPGRRHHDVPLPGRRPAGQPPSPTSHR